MSCTPENSFLRPAAIDGKDEETDRHQRALDTTPGVFLKRCASMFGSIGVLIAGKLATDGFLLFWLFTEVKATRKVVRRCVILVSCLSLTQLSDLYSLLFPASLGWGFGNQGVPACNHYYHLPYILPSAAPSSPLTTFLSLSVLSHLLCCALALSFLVQQRCIYSLAIDIRPHRPFSTSSSQPDCALCCNSTLPYLASLGICTAREGSPTLLLRLAFIRPKRPSTDPPPRSCAIHQILLRTRH